MHQKAKQAFKNGTGGIIHCNIENNEINKVVDSNFNFCMDSKDFINHLIKGIKYKERNEWLKK